MFISSYFLGWMNLFLSSTNQIKTLYMNFSMKRKKSMNSILVQFCEEGSKLNIPFKITPPLINPIVKYSYGFWRFCFEKSTQATITPIPNQNNHGRFNKQYLSFLGIHLVFQYKICVKIFFVISSKVLKPKFRPKLRVALVPVLVRASWVLVTQFDKSLNG